MQPQQPPSPLNKPSYPYSQPTNPASNNNNSNNNTSNPTANANTNTNISNSNNASSNQSLLSQAVNKQQKINCFYAALNIQNSRYARLYNQQHNGTGYGNQGYGQIFGRYHQFNRMFRQSLSPLLAPSSSSSSSSSYSSPSFISSSPLSSSILSTPLSSFKHPSKKPQQKLSKMLFLKNNNLIILAYNKQTDRGDINFISTSQLKNRDFYYNKLQVGVGGVQCMDDGRYVLIADRRGTFSIIDTDEELNYNDIGDRKVESGVDGLLDFGIGPQGGMIVCGLEDRKCVIFDIQKERKNKKFLPVNTFDRHNYGVNSVNWHPYKSLIVSSSIYLNDTIKLWDPHSLQLVHESSLSKSSISRTMFHPQGNSYFSLHKQNMILQHDLRKRGTTLTLNLDFQPTHIQILRNNMIVVGDSGGYMSWYSPYGELIGRFGGVSGVSLFCVDSTNRVMVVGREKEHLFQIYCDLGVMDTS